MMMMKILSLLLLLFFTTTTVVESNLASLEDASAIITDSTEQDFDKMVVLAEGAIEFHWVAISGNTIKARVVHTVPSFNDLPPWMGWGVYDMSSLSDGATITTEALTTMNSDAIIAILKPFSMKKYKVDAAQLWSVTESAHQTLRYRGFSQRGNSDGSYSTIITFEKLLDEADIEDVRIHATGNNVFWWAWGVVGATDISVPEQRGAFALDFSGTSHGLTHKAPPTPAPVAAPPPVAPGAVSRDPDVNSDAWITAHNTRREAYFTSKGVGMVDLKWSSDLSHSAQGYADKLIGIDGCVIKHGYEGDHYGGENLFQKWTSSASGTHTEEEALKGWYEGEKDLPYGSNGHFTQVAWRPTKYVGCGMAQKSHNGGLCFIDVCRYIVPGNCPYLEASYQEDMLKDTSGCPPECPKEGCF